MSKVLIHTLIFSPDGVSTAYLYNDIALAFKKQGYDVVVLSTTPHFNRVPEQVEKQPMKWKVWGFLKESDFNGIKVYHVPQKKFKSSLLRVLGFAYWHVVSFFVGLFIKNVDVIVSPSPPLTIGVINAWLGKLKGCKVVYNVQEVYPDILNLKDGAVKKCLEKMERYVYRKSDAVTTIDQVFHDQIAPRMDKDGKLVIIPNFVDTDLYRPLKQEEVKLNEEFFPMSDSLKLLYAGNIGFAQDWEPLVGLARKTANQPIEYFVIGEGVMKSYLEKAKVEHGLEKLHIIPYQQRDLMPQIIAYSDIQFIFMSPKMDKQGFPSKVYTIMACGKPLLVCSGEDTPIVNFLKDLNCAKLVTTHNQDERVEKMADWLSSVSKEELVKMGSNGKDTIARNYTKEIVTRQYVELLKKIL